MNKIGFLGMGNMAQAMAAGFINSGKVNKDDIFAYAPNADKLNTNADRIGFKPIHNAIELVDAVDWVIIACKPYQIDDLLSNIYASLENKTLISVAAGWGANDFKATLEKYAGKTMNVSIQCIMPNTPALVGEGVMLFENADSIATDKREAILDLFSCLGVVELVAPNLMGIGGAVSGCGPAFMDLIMEAYADAAVKYGMSRATAYKIIAQTMLGSAKLQLETGKHPGVLKDEVCSPAGTTICGVDALEKGGLRGTCINSIDAIMNKKKNA